jgi:CRISPR/Cas system CSM-associated protein Csm3 (group 7 of RAMP superfamily)
MSDAILSSKNGVKQTDFHISTRDGVSINENGTAKEGCKFDFQVVEIKKKCFYRAVLELTHEKDDELYQILENVIKRIASDGISAGRKTSRGYGLLEAEIRCRQFDLSDKDEAEKWLEFNAFADNAYKECTPFDRTFQKNDERVRIKATLRMAGSFSVRVYSSNIGQEDYRPMKTHMEEKNRPVIPGTSWAGAFRHHMKQLAEQYPAVFHLSALQIDSCFGVPEENGAKQNPKKSEIWFSETAVEGGSPLTVTRNALDRFTMAPVSGALFKSEIWEGGSTELIITVKRSVYEQISPLLNACLLDLHHGLLTFGGESSIGRGKAVLECLTIDGIRQMEILGYTLKEKNG